MDYENFSHHLSYLPPQTSILNIIAAQIISLKISIFTKIFTESCGKRILKIFLPLARSLIGMRRLDLCRRKGIGIEEKEGNEITRDFS